MTVPPPSNNCNYVRSWTAVLSMCLNRSLHSRVCSQ